MAAEGGCVARAVIGDGVAAQPVITYGALGGLPVIVSSVGPVTLAGTFHAKEACHDRNCSASPRQPA
jgi:hypothetical protein